jgi:hypothetical protein
VSQYFGDFAEDQTVYIPFNTFDSNDPSASVTITNLADADIKVHKDGSTTQIVTDGATVAIDFDSITGNHLVTIDTSAHADYTTGAEYQVRIEGTTVDSATINAWIGCFSIERANGAIALLTGTNSLANIEDKIDIIDTNVDQIETAVITNAAGADVAADIIAIKAETALIVADTNELQTDDVPGLIATLDAVVDTVKVDTAAILIDTAEIGAAGAGLTALATAANLATVDTVVDGIQTDLSNGTDGLGAIKADTAAILIDTADIQPNYATSAAQTTAQNDLDIITGASGVNLLTATQASIDAIEADTNELQGDDVPGLIATLDAVVDTVKVDTAAILIDTAEIGTAGAGLTAILTTQMTESYAADGTAPTLAQAVFLIQQTIGDFEISGTTITAKKLDGSTTAATYTLDDGTSPTSRTRAT